MYVSNYMTFSNYGDRKKISSLLTRGWEMEGKQAEHSFSEQWKDSVWYYNEGYISLQNLFKDCSTSRVNCNVNHRLRGKRMCQCRFTNCNKWTTLMGDDDNRAEITHAWGQKAYRKSLNLSSDFAVNLKPLQNKNNSNNTNVYFLKRSQVARTYQSETNQAESLGTHLYNPPFFSKSPWSRLDSFILQLRKLETNSWWAPSPMPFPWVHNLRQSRVRPGFLNLGPADILGQIILHFGGGSGKSSDVEQDPWPLIINASSNPFSQTWQPTVSRHYQVFPWDQSYSTPGRSTAWDGAASLAHARKPSHLWEAHHGPGPAPGMKGTMPNNRRPHPSRVRGGGLWQTYQQVAGTKRVMIHATTN